MNRISSLVTGLVALLALGSCDSDADTSTPAPAPAVETAPAVEAPSKPKMGALQFVKAFSQALRTRWIEIGVHESQVRGPCALVVVPMKFHTGKEFETRLREEILLRKDGAWFIIPEALRSDAVGKGILEEHAKPLFEAFRKRLPALREKHK